MSRAGVALSCQEHSLDRGDDLVAFPAGVHALRTLVAAHGVPARTKRRADRILLAESASHGHPESLELSFQFLRPRENGSSVEIEGGIPRLGAGHRDGGTDQANGRRVGRVRYGIEVDRNGMLSIHLRVERGWGVCTIAGPTAFGVDGRHVQIGRCPGRIRARLRWEGHVRSPSWAVCSPRGAWIRLGTGQVGGVRT